MRSVRRHSRATSEQPSILVISQAAVVQGETTPTRAHNGTVRGPFNAKEHCWNGSQGPDEAMLYRPLKCPRVPSFRVIAPATDGDEKTLLKGAKKHLSCN